MKNFEKKSLLKDPNICSSVHIKHFPCGQDRGKFVIMNVEDLVREDFHVFHVGRFD